MKLASEKNDAAVDRHAYQHTVNCHHRPGAAAREISRSAIVSDLVCKRVIDLVGEEEASENHLCQD